jgi:hypothetical protein
MLTSISVMEMPRRAGIAGARDLDAELEGICAINTHLCAADTKRILAPRNLRIERASMEMKPLQGLVAKQAQRVNQGRKGTLLR